MKLEIQYILLFANLHMKWLKIPKKYLEDIFKKKIRQSNGKTQEQNYYKIVQKHYTESWSSRNTIPTKT